MERFSTILKRARRARGLTLDQVAHQIRCAKGYISGIESRRQNPPSAKLVLKLAKVYDLDPTTLLLHSLVEKVPPGARAELRDRVFGASEGSRPENSTSPNAGRPGIEPLGNEFRQGKPIAPIQWKVQLSGSDEGIGAEQARRGTGRASQENQRRPEDRLTEALMTCDLLVEGAYGASRAGPQRALQELASALHALALSWKSRKLGARRWKEHMTTIRLRLRGVGGVLSSKKRRLLRRVRSLVDAVARSMRSRRCR